MDLAVFDMERMAGLRDGQIELPAQAVADDDGIGLSLGYFDGGRFW